MVRYIEFWLYAKKKIIKLIKICIVNIIRRKDTEKDEELKDICKLLCHADKWKILFSRSENKTFDKYNEFSTLYYI